MIRKLYHLALSSIAILVTALPSRGAEKVSLTYGSLEFSISVAALETYAKEGKLEGELAAYAQYLKPQDLEALRTTLTTPWEIDTVTLSRLLNSSLGESSLQYLGELIQPGAGLNGFYSLRAALILATTEPDGLTLLNVFKKWSTPKIRINSNRVFQLIGAFTQLLDQTQRATALIERLAQAEAAKPALSANTIDLQARGASTWQKQTHTFHARARDRRIIVDLYLPPRKSPVLIISNGLGADRLAFGDLAEHLASHGFAVVALEHPGSSKQQVEDFFRGAIREVVPASELIDRPLDISYLLDEFETHPSLHKWLNLEQVGVLGHSIGGYTALAIAGAEFNLTQLQQECDAQTDSINVANLSMLLQCIALDLPPDTAHFGDKRVRGVFAINPFGSSLFGQSGLSKIPVPALLVAGSDDTVAPAVLEQFCPFSWLTTPSKHLALLQGGNHFYSHQGEASDAPDYALARRYLKAMSLAFAKTYVAGQPEYQQYLSAAYAKSLSQTSLQLQMISSLTPTQLSQSLNFTCPASSTSARRSNSFAK